MQSVIVSVFLSDPYFKTSRLLLKRKLTPECSLEFRLRVDGVGPLHGGEVLPRRGPHVAHVDRLAGVVHPAQVHRADEVAGDELSR